jgi:hypothetical protein
MSKKSRKRKQNVIDVKSESNISPSKEHISYLNTMAIFWLGVTFANIAVIISLIPYDREIFKVLTENLGSLAIYAIVFLVWKYYRITSRLKYRNHPDFQNKLLTDYTFAKNFNNSEIIKTLINYFLFSIPIFYMTGLSQDVLEYFGYKSNGFGEDIHNLALSIVSSISALILGLLTSYIYDKIKHKFP